MGYVGFDIPGSNALLAGHSLLVAYGYDCRELRDTIASDSLRRVSACQPDEQSPTVVTLRQVVQGLLEVGRQLSLIKDHCYRQTCPENTLQAEIAASEHCIETNSHVNTPELVSIYP
jgi:hypothetical protein